MTLWQLKQPEAAVEHYKKALRLRPYHLDARTGYAQVLSELAIAARQKGQMKESEQDLEEAAKHLRLVVHIDQQYVRAFELLGRIEEMQGKHDEAMHDFRAAAWLMATSPRPAARSGPRAVQLAKYLLLQEGGEQDARNFDVLAAAYAEAGDFSKAVEIEERALKLATNNGQESLAAAIRQRLSLYNRQLPFRDTPKADGGGRKVEGRGTKDKR